MAALLWLDTEKDEALDLGDPFRLLQVHAEMAHACGERYEDYPELFEVAGATMDQNDVRLEWLTQASEQAKRFLTEHGDGLSEHSRWVLGELVSKNGPGPTAPKVSPSPFEKRLLDYHAKAGFTGTREDALGRTVCFNLGKRVPCRKPPDPPAERGSQYRPNEMLRKFAEWGSVQGQDAAQTATDLARLGADAEAAKHAATEYVSGKIEANVSRLPPGVQKVVRGAWFLARLATKVAFVTYTTGQELAERVAKERGATPEQAARLRSILSAVDVATFKPVSIGMAAVAGPAVAAGASFVPLGSATYLAYSTARDPMATARAAKGLIGSITGKLRRKKGLEWGVKSVDEPTPPKVGASPFDENKHPRDEGGKFSESEGASTEDDEAESDSDVAAYLDAYNDPTPGTPPATVLDVEATNEELADADNGYRIVPDGKGKWRAMTVDDLESKYGEEWEVAENPLTGNIEVGDGAYYAEVEQLTGDEISRPYVQAFNDQQQAKPTAAEVATANREMHDDGSDYQLVWSKEYEAWVAEELEEEEDEDRDEADEGEKNLDDYAVKEGFTGIKEDKLGRRYCWQDGKRVPCPQEEGAAPKRERRKASGYGDDLPVLDANKEPLKLLEENDSSVLDQLGSLLSDPDELKSWDREGLLGWGPIYLDASAVNGKLGEDVVQTLVDRGWLSRQRFYGEGVVKEVYSLTRTARTVQLAKARGAEAIKPPATKSDVEKLVSLVSYSSELADVIFPWLGLDRETMGVNDLRPALLEMLYRRYNPVPVWERVAKDPVIQGKVKQLAGLMDEEIRMLIEQTEVMKETRRLEAQSEELWKAGDTISQRLWPPSGEGKAEGEERDRLKREYDELGNKFTEIASRLSELFQQKVEIKAQQREDVLNRILAVENPSEVGPSRFADGHSEAEKSSVLKAAGWLSGKVAKGPKGEALPDFGVINDNSDVFGRGGPSAYYWSFVHAVNVPSGMVSEATNAHEIGHGIEYKMPGAQSAAHRFLAYRVKDEPLRKLKEVMPDGGYAAWEEGRRDDFAKSVGERGAWYVGKKPTGNGGTEIVSMGIEQLYRDPSGFAQNDPEYCGFILSLLDGRGRDVEVPE